MKSLGNKFVVAAALAFGAYYFSTRLVLSDRQKGLVDLYGLPGRVVYKLPENSYPFLPVFYDAEQVHGLPSGLLARVAYQESHFRPEIISGELKSSAGAIGLMQIVPKWHPDVNPYNPVESIYYAAKYLKRLYNRFGTWKLALAAYNWGQGNLAANFNDYSKAPLETRNYVEQISRDVGGLG